MNTLCHTFRDNKDTDGWTDTHSTETNIDRQHDEPALRGSKGIMYVVLLFDITAYIIHTTSGILQVKTQVHFFPSRSCSQYEKALSSLVWSMYAMCVGGEGSTHTAFLDRTVKSPRPHQLLLQERSIKTPQPVLDHALDHLELHFFFQRGGISELFIHLF